MTHRPLSSPGLKLIETNDFDSYSKREQSYASIWNQPEFQPTHRARFSGLRNYRIPPLPISPSLDRAVAGF